MTTRVIECFDVQHWDGGERHNHVCYMVSEKDAKNLAGQHGLLLKKTIIVHDDAADYQQWKSGDVKRNALAKLTPEERAALGY